MSHDLNLINDYRVWMEEIDSEENGVTRQDPTFPFKQCFVIAGFFVIWYKDDVLEIMFGPLLLWSGKAEDYCVCDS